MQRSPTLVLEETSKGAELRFRRSDGGGEHEIEVNAKDGDAAMQTLQQHSHSRDLTQKDVVQDPGQRCRIKTMQRVDVVRVWLLQHVVELVCLRGELRISLAGDAMSYPFEYIRSATSTLRHVLRKTGERTGATAPVAGAAAAMLPPPPPPPPPPSRVSAPRSATRKTSPKAKATTTVTTITPLVPTPTRALTSGMDFASTWSNSSPVSMVANNDAGADDPIMMQNGSAASSTIMSLDDANTTSAAEVPQYSLLDASLSLAFNLAPSKHAQHMLAFADFPMREASR